MILLPNSGTPRCISSLCIRHFLIPTYVNLNPHLRRGDVKAPFTSLFACSEDDDEDNYDDDDEVEEVELP